MKVLYLNNIPSPYRVDFYNELGKKCELTVLFERNGFKTRDKNWRNYRFENFQGIILTGMDLGTYEKLCFSVVRYLKKDVYDFIVVGNATSVTGMLAIQWMKMNHIVYCIEGDGGFSGTGQGLKERLKRNLMSDAQLYFSTSEFLDEYYRKYGARSDQIYRYPFTSLYQKDIAEKPLSKKEKKKIKQDLRMREQNIILSVGSFIHRKGMDLLIQACAGLDRSWGIYIIGGRPTREYIRLKKKYDMKNLHFADFKEPHILKRYYEASDLFVLATREDIWGLVINEAMAKGLPVITTDRCIAGMELIREQENGSIVAAGSVKALKKSIQIFTEDKGLLERCSLEALKTIADYTIEGMVERHLEVFEHVLKRSNVIKHPERSR